MTLPTIESQAIEERLQSIEDNLEELETLAWKVFRTIDRERREIEELIDDVASNLEKRLISLESSFWRIKNEP
jgi:predicted  nucleic acid-binding Zn-ribbon protein